MTPEEMERALKVARAFQETYERLAPLYRYEQHVITWEQLTEQEQLFIVGIFADMLDKGVIRDG